MVRKIFPYVLLILLIATLVLTTSSKASGIPKPVSADSAYDLINAVNALRGTYGQPAYSINSILMFTAQTQAEFMAATGNVSHTGAGGSSVTSRLLAAGYPLAGDLSLGGFRSENIISGAESMTAQAAINAWTGDAPHLNTMISPNLTEIGAGVAIANGKVYYVIDCALPTTGGAPQVSTQSSTGGATIPAGEAVIAPVVLSTPNQNGEVVHVVQAGQTLWQIAIAYEVKIDEIKSLNNLSDNNIFPGDELVVKKIALAPTSNPTDTPTIFPMFTPVIVDTPTLVDVNEMPTQAPASKPVATTSNSTIMSIVIGSVALALLAGGFFAWRSDSKDE